MSSVYVWTSADVPVQTIQPPARGGVVQPHLRRPQPLHWAGDLPDLSSDPVQLDVSASGLQLGPSLCQDCPGSLVVLHQ